MPELSVRLVADPREAAPLAVPWLAAQGALGNVPATILAGELSGERHYADQSWALVTDAAGTLVAVAVQTSPHHAFVPPMGVAAAEAVARAWRAAGRPIPGVIGDAGSGAAFAACWAGLAGVRAEVEMREGVHVLRRFAPADGVPGTGRTARPEDLELILAWLEAFVAEAVPGHPRGADRAEELERVRRGEVVLWEDGGVVVSLAGFRPPAAGLGRIGPVYTPPGHRRHGYAAAVTTLASRRVLAAGATPMLHTDLDNPTSNGVYARLGFELVGELARWTFR